MDTTADDRRTGGDRRNAKARRRYTETRRLYVELCHSVLRAAVVVHEGDDSLPVLRTRAVRWRDEASDLLCDRGQAELAAALRSLVTEEKLAGCQVSLAISGTLCVNRATTGATARVEQEIASIRDRSQMYLALGPGEKTAAIARKPIDARHEHALVTVTNQRTLRLLVDAAESAGLVVDVVESALVALGRLHGRLEPDEHSAVVLAQVDEDRFEVGVSRQGQLLVEYRPSKDGTTDRLGRIVDQHHDRLKRFCQRMYGVGPADLAKMWVVGAPDEVAGIDAETKVGLATGSLPLERLGEFWSLREAGGVSAEMGAALGLALRDRFADTGVNPNLMDEIHALAREPIRPFLIRAAIPLAASLLIAATLWVVNLDQDGEVAALRARVEEVKPAQLRGQRLSRELADAATEIEHLGRLEKSTPDRRVTPLVQGVGFCLPDDVWLRGVRVGEQGELTVAGSSYTESGVYDLVRHLEQAPWFDDVALRGTGTDQTPQGPATSFDIDVTLAPLSPPASEETRK